MINNDSILNQLNNYKKLNNAGVGITMRSYPTYVERYYPIEDVIKIKRMEIKWNGDADFTSLNNQFNLTEYDGTSFPPQRKNITTFANLVTKNYIPDAYEFRIIFDINGDEFTILYGTVDVDSSAITINNYNDLIGTNLNSMTWEFQDPTQINPDVATQPTAINGSVGLCTDWSIFATYQLIGAHTEFILKYKPSLTEEYIASCNLALAFYNTTPIQS